MTLTDNIWKRWVNHWKIIIDININNNFYKDLREKLEWMEWNVDIQLSQNFMVKSLSDQIKNEGYNFDC